ncbi:endo alpha-1,4 polygalactosaminidase [Persephonella sp.]
MRRLCFSKIIYSLIYFVTLVYGRELPGSVCFYYDSNPPQELFYLCDWLILDPGFQIKKTGYSKIFAYVSIGEGESYREYFNELKKEWILGENKYWKTKILDIRDEDLQDFLIEKVFKNLKDYDGFFLDTLDSYRLVLKDKGSIFEYENALVEFIKKLKENFPEKKILINRGFEIINRVKDFIDGVAAESLYYGLDLSTMNYTEVPEENRKWLIDELKKIEDMGLPVVVIDYLPPREKTKAFEVAQKIKKEGFIPWITDKDIKTLGTSYFQFIPRKVLLLYDGTVCKQIEFCNVHRLASLIFEYLGYVPVLKDVTDPLPEEVLVDRYAGIVVWLQKDIVRNYQEFYNWILKKIKEGNKVVFVESFGFPLEEKYLKPLGIEVMSNKSSPFDIVKIVSKDNIFGFEADPSVEYSYKLLHPEKGKALLVIENSEHQRFVPAAVTKWGGYITNGVALRTEMEDVWSVNPFEFFKITLRLPEIPAPDTTTENGRRILFVHIDGDGFIERTEWNRDLFASEVIRDQIIKVFKLPHTVSVIEGEIAPWGLYPDISSKLENIARSIFRLENVEPASHSYSHPFKWGYLYRGIMKENYSLPIKNYRFNLEREIEGSVRYIQDRLLPEDKKVKIFQWTGDCMPPPEGVKLTYDLGLLNINGGDTIITNKNPWLSYVSPMGIDKNGYFQVYAAVQNENIYTDNWKGPFYGYQNVIQTFKLTEKPRRLKPINIYYHFYSGSKIASLKALKKVYSWALSQEVTPLYTSQWIEKVLDFRKIAVGFDGKGWLIAGDGKLKTVRFDRKVYPSVKKSSGVVGYKAENNRTYIHLDGSGRYYLTFNEKEKFPYLYDFNGFIKSYNRSDNSFRILAESYLPAHIRFDVPDNCTVDVLNREDFIREIGSKLVFVFRNSGEILIEGRCKQ